MPGANCSMVGCGSCRRTKGLSIIKLPASRNEAYKTWCENGLWELTKYCVVDAEFKELIENSSVYTLKLKKSKCVSSIDFFIVAFPPFIIFLHSY